MFWFSISDLWCGRFTAGVRGGGAMDNCSLRPSLKICKIFLMQQKWSWNTPITYHLAAQCFTVSSNIFDSSSGLQVRSWDDQWQTNFRYSLGILGESLLCNLKLVVRLWFNCVRSIPSKDKTPHSQDSPRHKLHYTWTSTGLRSCKYLQFATEQKHQNYCE